jgi:hypothetical protein
MMRITPLTGIAAIAGIISLGQFGPAFGEDHGSMTAATSPDDARIRIGFKIAPVKLNLRGKNRAQVGLGSYIVNAQAGCSDCHTYPSFAAGGDPFFGQPEVINTAQYLTGGRQFGPFYLGESDAGQAWPPGRADFPRIQDGDADRSRSGWSARPAPTAVASDALARVREDE